MLLCIGCQWFYRLNFAIKQFSCVEFSFYKTKLQILTITERKVSCSKIVIEVVLYTQYVQLCSEDRIFPSDYHLTMSLNSQSRWNAFSSNVKVRYPMACLGGHSVHVEKPWQYWQRANNVADTNCFTTLFDWHLIKHKLKLPYFV